MGGFFVALGEWPARNREALEQCLFLIPLFPFLGFLLNGLFGRRMDAKAAGAAGTLAAFLSFVTAFLCVSSLSTGATSDSARNVLHTVYAPWLDSPEFSCSFGLYIDQLSSVMILIVTGIGTLIHLYSMGYMAHDKGIARFFAYLNLFLFAMIILVLGDNLLMTFVGWEGVGLCSYLLIGFWYEEGKNAAAGMKAFVVNRVGDLGFLMGLFILIAVFGTVNFAAKPAAMTASNSVVATKIETGMEPIVTPRTVLVERTAAFDKTMGLPADPKPAAGAKYLRLPANPGLLDYTDAFKLHGEQGVTVNYMVMGYKADKSLSNLDLSNTLGLKVYPEKCKADRPDWMTLGSILTICCVLLFIGAMGKSAQVPLYVWLPDAMAGPTPVSALIHAATMVTSGIYMICRLHPIFSLAPGALAFIAFVGGFTALFAALIGLTQTDIKKVLAYSTVSQLGYMFLGLGVGMFSLGIFHVVTHAFFKALLFLCSGSVIHAMSGEQDMRKMGGLRKLLPITFWTMLIGGLALAGVPGLAGWFSKDAILMNVLAKFEDTHNVLYLLLYVAGCAAAFCTAFYTIRLLCLTFLGENRASEEVKHHIHESPLTMTLPLMVLAVLSVVGGFWLEHKFVTDPQEGLGITNVPFAHLDHEAVHHLHYLNLGITFAAAVGGILLAYLIYGKNKKVPSESQEGNVLYKASLNKFYVDEIYNALFVMPFTIASEVIHWLVDVLLIDGLVWGVGVLTGVVSDQLRKLQTGVVNHYALSILVGVLAVLFYLSKQH